jgi:holo-[acyl-carrier protein] synthase
MRIGIDLLAVRRFSRIAQHDRYLSAFFTKAELAQACALGPERKVERLAARWCVKEATCKALGRGFGQGIHWRDIEVLSDSWGRPVVALNGGAHRIADVLGLSELAVTLTHEAGLVVAVAVADDRRKQTSERSLQ